LVGVKLGCGQGVVRGRLVLHWVIEYEVIEIIIIYNPITNNSNK
jgi:hypothetical protein